MTQFKSKLKVSYDSAIGMWVINGESLTRRCVDGNQFYDKSVAIDFKCNIDNEDYYFHINEKTNESN